VKANSPIPDVHRVFACSVTRFFGVLGKRSLSVTDFPSKQALRDHLNVYMRA